MFISHLSLISEDRHPQAQSPKKEDTLSHNLKSYIALAKLEQPPKIPPDEYFSLEPVVNKGLGLIAKCDIKAGTRILIEDVMVSYDALAPDGYQAVCRSFYPANNRLYDIAPVAPFTDTQRDAYFKLARGPSLVAEIMNDVRKLKSFVSLSSSEVELLDFCAILQGIAQVNEFDKGVHEVASRINHSCSPNCASVYDEKGSDIISLYTIEDVKKGKELTVNYYPRLAEPHESYIERLLLLRGFLCVCTFCTLPSSERRRLIAIRERIRRLSEDFSFLLYRIEPKRLMNQTYLGDIHWGRIPHKRVLGPLPSSVIDREGNIQLDPACAELDHLFQVADMRGKDIAQLYWMMCRVVYIFADSRAFAKSGKAWLYAAKWWGKHNEEIELMGGLTPRGRESNVVVMEYIVEKCGQLRQFLIDPSNSQTAS